MPLSHAEIAHWSQLREIDIQPHEVDALMRLDAVMRYPGEAKK